MILKKSQKSGAVSNEPVLPVQPRVGKIGRRATPPLDIEAAAVEEEGQEDTVTTTTTESRVRLSADIEHLAYIRLKTYAAVVRKPLVAIIQDLIYSNCKV